MKIKLTPELTKALNKSITMARDNRHEYITLEHILFALLNEPTASRLLREVGVNVKKLEEDLLEYISTEIPVFPEVLDDSGNMAYGRVFFVKIPYFHPDPPKHALRQGVFDFCESYTPKYYPTSIGSLYDSLATL